MNKSATVLFFLVIVFLTTLTLGQTHSIDIEIVDIRNNKGRIQLQVYKDEKTFRTETPWKVYHVPKTSVKNNKLSYRIENIPKGTYGIALLDDENSDSEMNFSFFLPVEGFGFGDYYHKSWSKPKFDDFKFYLDRNKEVIIKIRYVN